MAFCMSNTLRKGSKCFQRMVPQAILFLLLGLIGCLPILSFAKTASSSLFGLNGVGFFHYYQAPNAPEMAEEKMRWLLRAGARWDRFDFWWGVIEPKPGVWNWQPADWLINFYAKHHIQMLPILCYQAAWMRQSPHTAQDFAQFADFVYHVVARYKKQVHCWEIWNEPNIPTFWKPNPSAEHYTALLKAAYTAAHKADPRCVVVGAAANEADINWLQAIGERGGLQFMDAVSIHPYSMSDGPEQMYLAQQIENVLRVLKAYGRPQLPIWITEMGWMSSMDDTQGIQRAATYLVQSYVIAIAEGVQHLFWFNEQDWIENNKLQGWGLLSPDMRPKQTFFAYQHLSRFLEGARFVGYLPMANGVGYLFRKGETERLVAWAHRGLHALLPLVRPHPVLTNMFGATLVVQNSQPEIGETPVFVDDVARTFERALPVTQSLPQPSQWIVNGDLHEIDEKGAYGWHKGVFYGGNTKGDFFTDPLSHALGLANTQDALWESWPIPIVPGDRYRLSVEMRVEQATGENEAQILFLSGPGWGWLGGPTTQNVTGTTEGWRTLMVEATAPKEADFLRVNLWSKGNVGRVLFRLVDLKKLPERN